MISSEYARIASDYAAVVTDGVVGPVRITAGPNGREMIRRTGDTGAELDGWDGQPYSAAAWHFGVIDGHRQRSAVYEPLPDEVLAARDKVMKRTPALEAASVAYWHRQGLAYGDDIAGIAQLVSARR